MWVEISGNLSADIGRFYLCKQRQSTIFNMRWREIFRLNDGEKRLII